MSAAITTSRSIGKPDFFERCCENRRSAPGGPQLGQIYLRPPPRHGSSPAQNVCGGAQRGISLAAGFFTGESTRKPLGGNQSSKRQYISGLGNHDLAKLDSFAEST